MALATILFNPWIAGVVLSAILAAVMSTLSAQLLVCSSALTEDFYKGFLRPHASQTELVWFGRFMVLMVALIAIWLAQDSDSRVLGLVSYAWAGFGAAFGPVIIFSLFWKRLTAMGALAGMVAGAVVVVAWKPLTNSALYEIVPGFIACSLVLWIVSLMTTPPATVVQRFDEAEAKFKAAQ